MSHTYTEQELKAFDLVDKILDTAIRENGASFYSIDAAEYSAERYLTFSIIVDHDLVIFKTGRTDRHSYFDVSLKGFEVIRMGGFKNYMDSLKNAEKKKKEEAAKAAEKLENDLWMSRRSKRDYKATRIIAYAAFLLSLFSFVTQLYKLFSSD